MDNEIVKLNRFTSLPFLIDCIENKHIVLVDPDNWEDRNDSEIIRDYRIKMRYKKLLALCFTHKDETIHHWTAYANSESGCCIEFEAKSIFESIKNVNGIRHKEVKYATLKDVKPDDFDISETPFIKRIPYSLEQEYRIIYESNDNKEIFKIPISLDAIRRITFGQKMPLQVFNSVKAMFKSKYPSVTNRIHRSTIYSNDIWINGFKGIKPKEWE